MQRASFFQYFGSKSGILTFFHGITIIWAIKCKVHNICVTKFFCKFVIKINPSKLNFYVIYAIFPNLTLSLATHRRIP